MLLQAGRQSSQAVRPGKQHANIATLIIIATIHACNQRILIIDYIFVTNPAFSSLVHKIAMTASAFWYTGGCADKPS